MARTHRLVLLFSITLVPAPALAADVTVTLDTGSGFVIQDNTGSVERLRVDEATGNISRNGALFMHTTGGASTFVGEEAGLANGGGLSFSTGFGWNALHQNTTGSRNAAFGTGSLSNNLDGSDNAAFGSAALASSNGAGNAAFGSAAMLANAGGGLNVAIGWRALESNTTGSRNIAIGEHAGTNATTGNDNIYIGNAGVAGESGQIKIGTASNHVLTTLDGGPVRIPWLTANADVRTDGTSLLVGITSTRRHKRNLEPFEDDYAKILSLHPYTFEYLEEGNFPKGRFLGFMAEELDERGLSELVRYDDEGRPTNINYDQISVYLIGLLKQHQAELVDRGREIESQRQTIEGQARVIEEQRRVIASLSDRMGVVEQALAVAPTGGE